MKSILMIFGLAFSVVITPAIAEESRNYWIGYTVTWAELCNVYLGYTIDHLRVKAIREAYEDDKEFQRGYKQERALFRADFVRGIGDCEEALRYFAEIDVSAVSGSSSTSATSQQMTTDLPLSFDGVWIVEIVVQSDRSPGDRVETEITDGEFSLDFSAGGYRGTITGEIDRTGRLSATGIARWISAVGMFQFSTLYNNSSFQKIVTVNTQSPRFLGRFFVFEITLTRASPTTAVPENSVAGNESIEERLRELKSLQAEGLISEEEAALKRSKFLMTCDGSQGYKRSDAQPARAISIKCAFAY